jgi:hypothetical protein
MKSLEQFKNDTLGGSFAKPRIAYPGDGWYVGECVSYVRQYMEQVQGIITENYGHALDFWSNRKIDSLYEKVTSPQDGDLVVWKDDDGNWTGKEGHIAIWCQGQILNQNYGGSRRVTMNKMFTSGLLGYLRLKTKGGEEPMFNEGDRVNVNLALYNTDKGRFKSVIGKSWKDAVYGIYNSDEYREDAFINKGDVVNINEAFGRTDADALTGKPWKQFYAFAKQNVPGAEPTQAERKLAEIKAILESN